MANIFEDPKKAARKAQLFEAGIHALENDGWQVEKIPGFGKGSVRKITKGSQERIVSIRTTQDQWIAFPRNDAGDAWVTLSDVDAIVAVSVDDKENPRFAQVHLIEGDEMRARFDRAYQARIKAGHSVPKKRRGIWISLYDEEASSPVSRVGAGAGIAHKPIARIPLAEPGLPAEQEKKEAGHAGTDLRPLSISDAKKSLSMFLGVPEESIEIIIRS
ncbi:hypothetical protein AA0242T_2570 [Acetobacter aceti NRIC 0242]|jgi:hypothetical protein|uniref:Uncharacterized protein n=2 Tax=Acetobacter aceti TaxID=435 RepID=A0A6S6PVL0_ACEAC|nr:hypothetical protein [Acetobacter aceti]TCS26513.1 hypothetical protein EDC15_1282 [Acetobacter aceti NBRC 14818]BCI69034.1 hypothetical protein AAJCM20276_36580 [Acetobacter aceti]BCK77723.1 hypothetical protein EMQ_P136 [Acetobacter aceti NBRC 14818]GBO81868.1 hypothetical protein AA0242T_2570 [Acetobacter aceti NRIC 0242]